MQFFRVLKSLPRDNLQIANKFFTSSYQLAEQSARPQTTRPINPRKPFPYARTNASPIGTANEFNPSGPSADGGETIEHYPVKFLLFL